MSRPTNVSQYQILASAYLKLGNNAKAVEELNSGLRLDSTDRDFYQEASNILEQIGDYEAAANALEMGRAHAKPNDGLDGMANETLRRGAKALILAEKNKEALKLALASLEKDPKSERGQRLAGIAYINLKETGKGEEHLQIAMGIQPTAYAASQLGELRITQKRFAEARAFAEQAIDIDPNWPSGYETLEFSVQNAQDAAEAIALLAKYAMMSPPNKLALPPWSYIQTKYMPYDAAVLHQQYSAYKAATKDVPYGDWFEGWSDFVELSMLDNHIEDAGHLADALLGTGLGREDTLTMGFYSWLTYLLAGDCKHFESKLNASLEVLRGGGVAEKDGWDFTATRKFVANREAERQLNTSAAALVTAGLKLLEGSINTATIEQFGEIASQSVKKACPAN